MSGPIYDLAIIGGGINGCSIARDAAGRGLSVFLCEQDDLAAAASAASGGLILTVTNGLRPRELGHIRESLKERALLLAAAPHIVRPVEFLLPAGRGLPRAVLGAGLLVHEHLGGRGPFPAARRLTRADDPAGGALRAGVGEGFAVSAAWADDTRLVIATAMDARAHGAAIEPRLRCVIAEREGRTWRLSLESSVSEDRFVVEARALVNAAGPRAPELLNHVIDTGRVAATRLVRRAYVVVRRLFDHDRGYALRNGDGRFIFLVPYEDDFTLIGATEDAFAGDPGEAAADSAETAYLLAAVNGWLRQPVYEDQVVWSFAACRAVPAAGAKVADPRHGLDLDSGPGRAPLVTAFGGTMGAARRLAERALALLAPAVPAGKPWTSGAALPGGGFEAAGLADLKRALLAAYPFVGDGLAARLVRSYGTLAPSILSGARRMEDLGRIFGTDLIEAEVRYLVREEWARTAEDILWRRSKLGLRFTAGEVAALEEWLADEGLGLMAEKIAGLAGYGTASPRSTSGRPIDR